MPVDADRHRGERLVRMRVDQHQRMLLLVHDG